MSDNQIRLNLTAIQKREIHIDNLRRWRKQNQRSVLGSDDIDRLLDTAADVFELRLEVQRLGKDLRLAEDLAQVDKEEHDEMEDERYEAQTEVLRLQNIIIRANNILFDAHHHTDDVEHYFKCHPETIEEHFQAAAKGVNEALAILSSEVLGLAGFGERGPSVLDAEKAVQDFTGPLEMS
jgi:hypothetical protein